MTESEFLKRFDQHVERFDAHAERIEHTIARLDTHVDRNNELLARVDSQMDESRSFMREVNRRAEIVLRDTLAELADHRDQIRANTEATWAMIDRLGPRPS